MLATAPPPKFAKPILMGCAPSKASPTAALIEEVKVEARATALKELQAIHEKELEEREARIAELEKQLVTEKRKLTDENERLRAELRKHAPPPTSRASGRCLATRCSGGFIRCVCRTSERRGG